MIRLEVEVSAPPSQPSPEGHGLPPVDALGVASVASQALLEAFGRQGYVVHSVRTEMES